jgi:hypothetical protein
MLRVTPSSDEAADQLRGQASSCRSLARHARTELGSTALLTVANQFDADASRLEWQGRMDPDGGDETRGRLRAALARQEELWLQVGPRTTGARPKTNPPKPNACSPWIKALSAAS